MPEPSGFMTCSTKACSLRSSSSAENWGLPSSISTAFDWRWREDEKTMRPSGR